MKEGIGHILIKTIIPCHTLSGKQWDVVLVFVEYIGFRMFDALEIKAEDEHVKTTLFLCL